MQHILISARIVDNVLITRVILKLKWHKKCIAAYCNDDGLTLTSLVSRSISDV